MPTANWGITKRDFDSFDREKQFKPYTGPIPPSGAVFTWKIKVLKFFPATNEKTAQLRIGLELVPMRKEDNKYKGYFVMTFRSVTPKTQFNYVPFCDAIGVTATDFIDRTNRNQEGDILRIGRWRNDGNQLVMAQLKDSEDQNGNLRKDIGWIGPVEDTDETEDDYEDDELDEEIDEDDYIDDEDEEASDEYEEEDEEPAPPKRKRAATSSRSTPSRRGTVTRSKRSRSSGEPF